MKASGFGFIAPLLALMMVAFNAPIAYMLGLAFWDKAHGFTFAYYQDLLEAPVYLRVLGNTMRIAVIATLANVIVGYPLAHWMRGLQNRARLRRARREVLASAQGTRMRFPRPGRSSRRAPPPPRARRSAFRSD